MTTDQQTGETPESDMISTMCPHLGRPCPAATRMLQALERAGRAARRVTPELDMTGTGQLDGCARACSAVFHLSPEGVAVFCGVSDEADVPALGRFAADFLACDGPGTMPVDAAPLAFALSPVPAEMVTAPSARPC